ncbi:PQQ-dependent sugar dehydrogenase [Methylophaga thiooxydans]|uniref:Glucose / Sorbosone dehydrogenase domain protein n=1 Tax=Methylophaga thiooxydans DMS010 TaxID=637616 RepID=C0N909_9GAMM|nr:PQQ-dependent sugar dehydrogenase [Methylophaga thiooxydans]EEF78657.1 Glucose / Sorbosone dehydrogenase domain protein [Methylophaga thiooxydans DMS010]
MRFLTFNGLLLALIMPFFVQAEINGDNDLHVEQLAKGLSIPWGMAVLPDNSLLITQRNNTLSHLNPDSGKITNIMGLPEDVLVSGQGGLFDVQLSPDYANNGWLYFSYNKEIDGQGATTLSRAKLQDKQLVNWQDLLVTQSRTDNKVHFGGRISFDNNGHVFLAIGDRGERDNAQNRSNHAGSILRLNLDGTVPDDNPFRGQANVLPEIWSYGHRNPQGLFFNQQTGQLWAIEHGPRGGDEINLVQAGKNYGWPVISYGKEYWAPLQVGEGTKRKGMEQPVQMYDPSIAPSSLIQYQGTLFKEWHGKLLAGALKLQHLNIITLDDQNQAIDEQRLLNSLSSRIRNVIEAPHGALILGTDSGNVYRVTPAIN